MGVSVYLDTILVPLSLFLTVGYHAYLWHTFTTKPSITSIGIDMLRRRSWFQGVKGVSLTELSGFQTKMGSNSL